MCLPVRLALRGGGPAAGTGKLAGGGGEPPALPAERPWSAPRAAVAAPRQSEAAAPLAEAGPREGSGRERRLQRFGENEA